MRFRLRPAVIGLLLLPLVGCTDRDSGILQPAPPNDDPVVFQDDFGSGVRFEAFAGSNLDALVGVDTAVRYNGTASLKVNIPPAGDWAGGAFPTDVSRDLSGYDALTFWARASRAATLNVVGLGNDNTGTSLYDANSGDYEITTDWQKFVVPIPRAARLTDEKGLFYFAEEDETTGYELWFDDVRFEALGIITNPRPVLGGDEVETFVGAPLALSAETTFDVSGTDRTVFHSPWYFDFTSSDPSVIAVTEGGVNVVGVGTTLLTAQLGPVPAEGELTVTVSGAPTEAAPTPPQAAADVIALFSDAYTAVPVDRFSADWDYANVLDFSVAGNPVKVFEFFQTNWNGTAIEFVTPTIDASAMTHFHMDVWIPDDTSFRIKIVDFGEDNVFGGMNDTEHELTLSAASTPALVAGEWVSLDIPLTDFTGLTARENLAQIILSGPIATLSTVFVDNLYFHR